MANRRASAAAAAADVRDFGEGADGRLGMDPGGPDVASATIIDPVCSYGGAG